MNKELVQINHFHLAISFLRLSGFPAPSKACGGRIGLGRRPSWNNLCWSISQADESTMLGWLEPVVGDWLRLLQANAFG